MWYPVSLKVNNLFSYQDSTIDFLRRKGKMTCIYGSNQTDPKVLSNGSGKTSLLDIIAIALTESPLRKITKKSVVRRTYTSGSLEFVLKNDVLKKELLIKRFIEKTKGNKVELWENGVLNDRLKDLKSTETNKYILSLLDISEDDLLNYYLLGKETYQSFFTSKDAQKKEVINRFSKANIVDPIEGLIKADIKPLEEQLNEFNNTIINKKAKIEVLNEQIDALNAIDKEQEKKEIIEVLELETLTTQESIDKLEEEIVTLQSSKDFDNKALLKLEKDKTIKTKIDELSTKESVLNTSIQKERDKSTSIDKKYEPKYKTLDDSIDRDETTIAGDEEIRDQTKDLISEIERHLADEIECPSCHHKFCFQDKEYNLEEAKIQLPILKENIEILDKSIVDTQVKVDQYKKDKEALNVKKKAESASLVKKLGELNVELKELNKQFEPLNKELAAHQKKINDLKISIPKIDTQITIKQNEINSLNKEIEKLLEKIDVANNKEEGEDKTKPLRAQIKVLEAELKIVNEKHEKKLEEKTTLEIWIKRFKKFKSYLANNSIGLIENLSNHYLQGMGTNLSISIDRFKEKADGELKEEITTEVSIDGGVTKEIFNEFSGGEKGKIDVSGVLSMQKLINLNSKSGGLDLLFFDEIIDAIDRVALAELVYSLNKVGQTILLISHIDLPEMENSIKVEKKLGISQIIEQ